MKGKAKIFEESCSEFSLYWLAKIFSGKASGELKLFSSCSSEELYPDENMSSGWIFNASSFILSKYLFSKIFYFYKDKVVNNKIIIVIFLLFIIFFWLKKLKI